MYSIFIYDWGDRDHVFQAVRAIFVKGLGMAVLQHVLASSVAEETERSLLVFVVGGPEADRVDRIKTGVNYVDMYQVPAKVRSLLPFDNQLFDGVFFVRLSL